MDIIKHLFWNMKGPPAGWTGVSLGEEKNYLLSRNNTLNTYCKFQHRTVEWGNSKASPARWRSTCRGGEGGREGGSLLTDKPPQPR